MQENLVRIATRQSPLALLQAKQVRDQLLFYHPDLQIKLIPIMTQGDMMLETPLAKIGGKGLFIKELERALLNDRADIAIHSMKDVTTAFPNGLGLEVLCEREDPRDAFVSVNYASLEALPSGAIVGTSSVRRQCQLRERYPHLIIRDLRGNVGTRLAKLDQGNFDAVILAVAGLKRLGMKKRIRMAIDPAVSLPTIGQGAIGIECRLDDKHILSLLAPLHHQETALRVGAERAMLAHLQGGDCRVPIGGYAVIKEEKIWLRALIGSPDGEMVIRSEGWAPITQAKILGLQLAEDLLSQGARTIISKMYQNSLVYRHE